LHAKRFDNKHKCAHQYLWMCHKLPWTKKRSFVEKLNTMIYNCLDWNLSKIWSVGNVFLAILSHNSLETDYRHEFLEVNCVCKKPGLFYYERKDLIYHKNTRAIFSFWKFLIWPFSLKFCFSFISDIMNVIFWTKRKEREREREKNRRRLLCCYM